MRAIQLILITFFCLLAANQLSATTIQWTGNHSNAWNHVENWDPMIVPTNSDDVIIPSTWTNEIIIAGANASCKTFNYSGAGCTINVTGGWELIISGDLNLGGSSFIQGPGGIEVIGNNDAYLNYSASSIINVNHINIKSNANVFLTRALIMPSGKIDVYSGNFNTMGHDVNVNSLSIVPGSVFRKITMDNSTVSTVTTNLFVLNGGELSSTNSILNNRLLIQTDGNINLNVVNSYDRTTIATVHSTCHISINELNALGSINVLGDKYSVDQSFSITNFNVLQGSSIVRFSPGPAVTGYHFYAIHTPTTCSGDVLFTDEMETTGDQVLFYLLGGATLEKASFANINVVTGSITVNKGLDIGNNHGVTFNQTAPQTFYWINGSGNWTDAAHWSFTSGGTSSGCVPGLNDHVIFNNGSGFSANDTVFITNHTFCNNLIADQAIINKPVFKSSNITDLTLNVAGDFDIRGFTSYKVGYQLFFRNKGNGKIYTGSHTILEHIYFTNRGTSELKTDLNCMNGSKMIFQYLGHLNTNGFTVTAGGIVSKGMKNPVTPRTLTLQNSIIYSGHTSLHSGNVVICADSLTLNAGTSEFIFPYASNQTGQLMIEGFSDIHFYNASFLNQVGSPQLVFNQSSSFNKVNFHGNGKVLGASASIAANMSSIDTLIIAGKYKYEFEENSRINIRKKLINVHSPCNEISIFRSTSLVNKAYLHSSSIGALTLENILIENMEASGSGIPFIVLNGVNGGNNAHFDFSTLNTPQVFYWNGEGMNAHWGNGENWNIGVQPHTGINNDKILYNLNGCIPGYNDSVVFHINSFPIKDTVVINENANFKGMMWMPGTGSNRLITGGSEYTMNNHGGLEFDTDLLIDFSGDLIFRGSTVSQLYFRFVEYPGSILFYNLGTYHLRDQLTCTGSIINFQAGNFYSNNQIIQTNRLAIRHENAPINHNNIVDFGTSNILINFFFSGNFIDHVSTLNAENSYIRYFSQGSYMSVMGDHPDVRFGKIDFVSNVGNVGLLSYYHNGISRPHYKYINFGTSASVYGENSIDTLILAEGMEYMLESNTTQYINDLLYSKGSPCFRTTITSTQPGTRAFIKNQNCHLLVEHARLRDIEGILGSCGANNYLVGVGGEDMGNNLNWNFIPGNPINGLGEDTILTCRSLPYLQTTSGFGRYESIIWDNGSTDPQLFIDTVSTISATVVYSPTCIVSDSRVLGFDDQLQQNATVNNIHCFGEDNGSIDLSFSDIDTSFSQHWIFPDMHTRAGSTHLENLSEGNYTSIVTIPGYEALCSDTISVTIHEPAQLIASIDTTIAGKCSDPDGIILISAKGGTGELSYTWSNENTSEDNYSAYGGNNTVIVKDENGCTASLSTEMDCIDHLNIPELLTPNDDGYSDEWEIIDLYRLYPNNNVKILNRWGNVVYQKEGYNNEFTGLPNVDNTLSMGYLPSGTYFYVIDLGKGYKTLTGYIELVY